MSDMGRSFSGSMPAFYDQYLVPLIFEPFARRMARCLHGMIAGDVLELAAGTGVVTRALATALPPSVNLTATDLNPAMLARARTHAGLERVAWREADACALPFPDEVFDKVVCQFGVMFFPDKLAAFREARRVLRPAGEFLFNVWGRRDGTVLQISSEIAGRILNRTPESMLAPDYRDPDLIIRELTAAGFGHCVVEELDERSIAPSARHAAIATCHGGLLRSYIDAVMPDRLHEITDAVADAIAIHFGSGTIDAPLRAVLFACVRDGTT